MYVILFRFYKSIVFPLVFLGLFLYPQKSYSQQNPIDSLESLLAKSSGIDRVDVLIELARANYFTNTTRAFEYINLAQSGAIKLSDRFRIVRSSRIKGQVLRKLERLEESIAVYEEVYNSERAIVGTDPAIDAEMMAILNGLGVTYSHVANYDKALDYHFQALVLKEKYGDFSEISISLNNIGFVYFKLKDYEKALEYLSKSLESKKIAKDLFDLDRLYINIGMCNIHLKNFEEALKSINDGFGICGNKCSDEILVEGEFGRGVANYNLKNFEVAQTHFKASYELSQRLDLKRWMAENLVYMARLAVNADRFEEAKGYLTQGEEISRAYRYNQLLLDHYKEFSNLYSLSTDFQNASLYQNKYIALKDSLIGEELVKNIARTQTQFEERENIKTIALKDEALSRQRMLNLAIGTIAFLAALLVFVLYQSNKVKRRVNAKLSDANAIIAEQNKQLQAHSNILQAEVNKATADLLVANQSLDKVNKELDNFIYKTSHDIRGPLASLKGMCNVALIDVKDDLALDYLRKLDATATKLNRILTRLLIINQINNATLNPEPLDMDGIVDDIIRLETKKGLPAGFIFKREIQRNMAIRSDDALIRIILENLIDNSIKFYNDSDRIQPFVLIKIFTDKTYLNIHVIDNGVGISSVHPDKIFQMFTRASEKSGTGGLGLYLIKQSANRLGGDVGLRLTEHGDTEFYVTLPLEIPSELLEKKEDNKLAPSVKV
ncbi:MAG: tetratricopeptide repeat-containing sensor histidine kinase [Cyclobacteriaceae bacterium]|nr:tetratricopeptide repeat-containing sensor histidine kinase [Cyclobacteriaceae bacterium]MBX2957301.1 tetratricopeptide repeat-containing sensor histidine kinase [Cyclobacteriaceae bacterium]